jgi:hypothetical protein
MPVKFPQLPAEGRTSERIQAEQIKLLYANAPFALVITVLNALMLVLLQWGIDHRRLLAWLSYSVTVAAARATGSGAEAGAAGPQDTFCSGYSDHSAVESATR